MIEAVLLCASALFPQTQQPPVRPAPTSRPSANAQMRPAEWGDDAPGMRVINGKFLPIRNARYAKPAQVAGRVRDADLVIGLVVRGQAVAYPINMLGGPQREIINEEYRGVAFCVNW